MEKRDSNEGFTMVEVALVLAIAGLIFLMVFIALPAVQRTQRDAKRRDDVGALLTAIQKYQSNNRGAFPEKLTASSSSTTGDVAWTNASAAQAGETTWAGLYKSFLGETFADPLAGAENKKYVLTIKDCNVVGVGVACTSIKGNTNGTVQDLNFPNGYKMYVIKGATCNGSIVVSSSNPKKAAVTYKMEGPGSYCANL